MLKFGLLGMSEGNGHPYSWSAIFNGYNPNYMKNCPFPGIHDYLSEKKFPDDAIKEAAVTHIWTQEMEISNHIAKASNIKNIVKSPEEMIGKVDAVLLARDDHENHFRHSEAFIKGGVPIYIDKPIAANRCKAVRILNSELSQGQIFTCSPLKYAKEFSVGEREIETLGEIKSIHAIVMKSWDKYSIHVLDPILNIIGFDQTIKSVRTTKANGTVNVVYLTNKNILINITVIEAATYLPFKITILGTNNLLELEMKDTFDAFKSSLQKFINIIKKGSLQLHTKKY